jgi:hypothetical protein
MSHCSEHAWNSGWHIISTTKLKGLSVPLGLECVLVSALILYPKKGPGRKQLHYLSRGWWTPWDTDNFWLCVQGFSLFMSMTVIATWAVMCSDVCVLGWGSDEVGCQV